MVRASDIVVEITVLALPPKFTGFPYKKKTRPLRQIGRVKDKPKAPNSMVSRILNKYALNATELLVPFEHARL